MWHATSQAVTNLPSPIKQAGLENYLPKFAQSIESIFSGVNFNHSLKLVLKSSSLNCYICFMIDFSLDEAECDFCLKKYIISWFSDLARLATALWSFTCLSKNQLAQVNRTADLSRPATSWVEKKIQLQERFMLMTKYSVGCLKMLCMNILPLCGVVKSEWIRCSSPLKVEKMLSICDAIKQSESELINIDLKI